MGSTNTEALVHPRVWKVAMDGRGVRCPDAGMGKHLKNGQFSCCLTNRGGKTHCCSELKVYEDLGELFIFYKHSLSKIGSCQTLEYPSLSGDVAANVSSCRS